MFGLLLCSSRRRGLLLLIWHLLLLSTTLKTVICFSQLNPVITTTTSTNHESRRWNNNNVWLVSSRPSTAAATATTTATATVSAHAKINTKLFLSDDAAAAVEPSDETAAAAAAAAAVNVLDDDEAQKTIESIRVNAGRRTSNQCWYLPEGSKSQKWVKRKNLNELKIGDELRGRILSQYNLLDAKTGAKVFFECGVGRRDRTGRWHIVHGMLRIKKTADPKDERYEKKVTMARKKAAKMADKDVTLYVSRIRLDNGQLEVCLTEEEALKPPQKVVPASSLKVGQELEGNVVKVLPHGVFVDVGANRKGLLHISAVADLYGRYIDKEKGLKEAGLAHGVRIKCAVVSNEKKRMALGFTDDVKQKAKEELQREKEEKEMKRLEKQKKKEEQQQAKREKTNDGVYASISSEEAAQWAAYAAGETKDETKEQQTAKEVDDEVDDEDEEGYYYYEDEEYDDYEEDRAAESALGLDYY